jgi:hypothetical protein
VAPAGGLRPTSIGRAVSYTAHSVSNPDSETVNAAPADILRAVVNGDYGRADDTLIGDDAELVRMAYYRYWSDRGKPNSEFHRCLARAIFADEEIPLWFVRPALAAMLGAFDRPVEVSDTRTSRPARTPPAATEVPLLLSWNRASAAPEWASYGRYGGCSPNRCDGLAMIMETTSQLDGYLVTCDSELLESPYFRVSWSAIPEQKFAPGRPLGESYICRAKTDEEALSTVRQRARLMIRKVRAELSEE